MTTKSDNGFFYPIKEFSRHESAFYIIQNHGGHCFDRNGAFVHDSNDWAHLIQKPGGFSPPTIGSNATIIDEDVIPVISGFRTGVHAYVGILSILMNYIDNKEQLKNKKLLVYNNAQEGILQIIDYLADINHIERSDIIYLDPDVLYQFNSVTIIPNSLHSYFENDEIRDNIGRFVNNNLTTKEPTTFRKISIIKHHSSGVSSTMGSIDYELAKSISKKNGYELLEPSEVGEIDLINYLYNAEKLLFSWGTTFMKNFIYISDSCNKIDVLITGHHFKQEYDSLIGRGVLPPKFKNANITYHLEPDFVNLTIPNPNLPLSGDL